MTRWRRSARVVRDIAYLLLGRYGQYLVTLITIPIVARELGVHGIGLLAVGMSSYFYGSVLVDFGVSQVLTARVAQSTLDPGTRNSYLALRLFMLLLTGLLATPLILFGGPVLDIAATGLLAGSLFALNESWLLYGQQRFGVVSLVQTFGRVGYFAGVALTIHSFPSAQTVIMWLGVSGLFTNLVIWRCAGPAERQSWSRVQAVDLARLGVPVVVARLLATSYTQGASLLYSSALSTISLGLFSASDRLVRAAQSLFDSLGLALLPRIARRKQVGEADYWSGVWKSLLLAFGLGIVGAAAIILSAPAALRFLYGPGFEEATNLLRLQAFLLPGAAVATVATNVMMYVREDSRSILIAACIGLSCALIGVGVMLVHPAPVVAVVAAIAAEWSVAVWCVWRARVGAGHHLRVPSAESREAL